MKRRRKKKINFNRIFGLVALALLVPASVHLLWRCVPLLGNTGERVAMLAVTANMPQEGLDLLKDRFEEELYQGRLPETSQQQEDDSSLHLPGSPWVTSPQPSDPQTDSPTSQEDMPPSAAPSTLMSPPIPEEYRAPLISENFASNGSLVLVQHKAGYIKNESQLTNAQVETILETPMDLLFSDTDEPQVLIVHTHATEAFEPYDSDYYDMRNDWRSRNNSENMVAVGDAMAKVLENNGIVVIHDTTQHDYPSYNGSYERSAETIQHYLDEYPTIKVVLDLHRDAMARENDTIVKPVAVIEGKKAAQVMIIAAADDTGELGVPEYKKNLRFAATLQSYMAGEYKDLTRPVYFSYRKYNMDLTTGSLLLEFGSNANTLDEAVYSATLAGEALVELIYDYME